MKSQQNVAFFPFSRFLDTDRGCLIGYFLVNLIVEFPSKVTWV